MVSRIVLMGQMRPVVAKSIALDLICAPIMNVCSIPNPPIFCAME